MGKNIFYKKQNNNMYFFPEIEGKELGQYAIILIRPVGQSGN